MTSRRLPPAPHPIASAFFDDFDARQHDDELETKNTADNVTRGGRSSGGGGGSTVAMMRNSLGWRTRHSSSASYPVSVLPVKGRRGAGEGGQISASFRVRQVFPRQSHRGRTTCDDGDYGAYNIRCGDGVDGIDDGIENLPASVSEDDCELGTGATVWPGSIVLLKYLERLAHDPRRDNVLEGKTVADLGSGTAVTSIASALLGADVVVCTDGCDPVVDLARRNIRDAIYRLGSGSVDGPDDAPTRRGRCDNFRGCKMFARKYRWGEGMPVEGQSPREVGGDGDSIRDDQRGDDAIYERKSRRHFDFDVILGADCIVPKLYPLAPLVDALDELSGDGTVSYLSYEARHFEGYDPADEFRRLAGARGLGVEVVPDDELHPMYPADDIQVWRVTRDGRCGRCAGGARADERMRTRSDRGGGRSNHKSLLVEGRCS